VTQSPIIWISFTLAFVVGPDTWAPEYRPIDIIHVGHMPDGYGGRSTNHSAILEIGCKPLEAGTVTSDVHGLTTALAWPEIMESQSRWLRPRLWYNFKMC
jgi:hypothetical protein